MTTTVRRNRVRYLVGLVILAAVLAINGPVVISFVKREYHYFHIRTGAYKRQFGFWSIVPMPAKDGVNGIHAVLLHTGDVLIIAGSGNNQGNFNVGEFKSLLWNPQKNTFKKLHTPYDMFCGGNTLLPNGDLLFAGGTARYENLTPTNAAGVMTVVNRNPYYESVLQKGTVFTSASGVRFKSIAKTAIPAATMAAVRHGAGTRSALTPSSTQLWVQAVKSGSGSVINKPENYAISSLSSALGADIIGQAPSLTRATQNFWGTSRAYIFDPAKERYERVSNMQIARWYPTLASLPNGNVLAVSGLDQFGRMIQGTNEEYNLKTGKWAVDWQLTRVFPTYPALFTMPNGKLFFSGSNAGYGSATIGRTSGIWDLKNNSFQKILGMRNPHDTETSGSVLLPPAQAQRYAIVGGGGVGQSNKGTGRIDVVDLKDKAPRWHAANELPVPTRYPNLVITPDDTLFISNGSKDYRGMHGTNLLQAFSFNPKNNSLTKLAAPEIGRDYHSEALLLPNGSIITIGGNPLFGNKEDTEPQTFEQRLELYNPPYLYKGPRPSLSSGPTQVRRGTSPVFTTPDAQSIKTARLIYPSASTHVTTITQRSIALAITRRSGAVALKIPHGAGLVPSGWWMLFVTNAKGVPSIARWVHVN